MFNLSKMNHFESAESDIFLKAASNLYAYVDYNGSVNVVFSATNLRTRCEVNVYKFPFGNRLV